MVSFSACASPPIHRPHRLRSWLAACASALLLAACGGGGGDVLDNLIDKALNFEGQFEALDGLVIELNDETKTATIVDFGTSRLGTNASVLPVGAPFARYVVRTGDATFSAEVLVPSYNDEDDSLQSVAYTPVTVSLASGTPVITGAPAGYAYATGWTAHVPAEAFGENCRDYWQPILEQGSARWRVTKAVNALNGYDGIHPDKHNWVWAFSNFRSSGHVHAVQSYYSPALDKTITPDPHPDAEFAQFPLDGEPHCRINADAAGTLFFKSYDAISGELMVYESQQMDHLTWVRD